MRWSVHTVYWKISLTIFLSLDKRKKTSFSISLQSFKSTIFLILFTYMMPLTGHVSHVNVIMAQLTIESLWLSGRAAELGIWQSKVWFLMGTHKFSSHEVHAKTNKCLTVLSYFCKGWQDLEITLIVCKPKALLPVDCGCKGKEISLNFFCLWFGRHREL